jgi:hypothetical protein
MTKSLLPFLVLLATSIGVRADDEPAPAVEGAVGRVVVSTLDGRELAGTFVSLSRTEVVLSVDGEDETVPVANLLEIGFPDADGADNPDLRKTRLLLLDGTVLDADVLTVNATGARVESVRAGTFEVPTRSVQAIRFPGADAKYAAAWGELLEKPSRGDLLVVRKPDVLDRLTGIIGDVTATDVRFSIGDNQIPVKLEKLYGVVYGNRNAAAAAKPSVLATLHGGDVLALASIARDGDAYVGHLAAGAEVTIPAGEVRSLDYSIGKVRYLSRAEPESVEYVKYWPDPFDDLWIRMRRNENQQGEPIRIGKRTFTRGLWMHSRTTATYRLAGEYRTFKAVLGMEAIAANKGYGNDVRVVVRADGETLLDVKLTAADEARELDLDVSSANFLELEVDFGDDGAGTLDHVAFGDARVLK